MTAWIAALVAVALAAGIQGAMLAHRARLLKARQQAFHFHAIRDELQYLALKGEVDPHCELYEFLMFTSNLAIRNAGIFRLRDLIRLARTVKQEIPDRFVGMIESQPESLQRLAGQTFVALTQMLIANDPIVRAGVECFISANRAKEFVRPIVKSVVSGVDTIARQVLPSHAEAVRHARDYSDIAGRLAA